jgi:hypothetical protein
MSLLSTVQVVALKVGLSPQPAVALTSTDSNILQRAGYASEAGQEISARFGWESLTKEATFSCPGLLGGITALGTLTGGAGYASGGTSTYGYVPLTGGTGSGAVATVAVTNGVVTSVSSAILGGTGSGFSISVTKTAIMPTQSQGVLTALTGPDFGWILNETMWDRTSRRPVFGPKAPAEWQQLQAQLMNGPWWQYRIRGGQLLFTPAPAVGDQIYFEWISKYWVAQTATPTLGYAAQYGADTDVSIIDEHLIALDTLWRYKRAKKLEYSEDFDIAEAAINDAMTRNASAPILNLGGADGDMQPGIFLPAGSWAGTYGH